jgi:cytochrome c oxidase cbb3-type subunit 1
LIGGPVPIWMTTSGIVAAVMMVIPTISVALNLYLTVQGTRGHVRQSPALRFIIFGICAFVAYSMLDSVIALPTVSEIVHFTHFSQGMDQTALYGFFSMVMFGAIYYMVPRLLKREWPSPTLIYLHFWGSALGVTVTVVALLVGGWFAGVQMNDATVPFLDIVQATIPWLKARSIGAVLLTLGHVAFAINFFWMLFATGSVRAQQGPTLLQSANQEGAA